MLLSLVSLLYAQGTAAAPAAPAAGAAPSPAGFISGLMPLLLIVVAFIFLIIMPQRKTQKEHQKLLENLKKGDVVVFRGIIGTITGFEGQNELLVRIANNVEVKILKGAVDSLRQGTQS